MTYVPSGLLKMSITGRALRQGIYCPAVAINAAFKQEARTVLNTAIHEDKKTKCHTRGTHVINVSPSVGRVLRPLVVRP